MKSWISVQNCKDDVIKEVVIKALYELFTSKGNVRCKPSLYKDGRGNSCKPHSVKKIEANALNQSEKICCLLLKAYIETRDNTTLTQLSTRESRNLDCDDLRKVYSTVFECLQK